MARTLASVALALVLVLALALGGAPRAAAGGARRMSDGVLTFQVCGGLFNQYAGVVDAVSLGHALGLTVLVGSLQTRYDMSATSDGVASSGSWTPLPFDALFSYEALAAALPDVALAPLSGRALGAHHVVGVPPGHLRKLSYFEAHRDDGAARAAPGAPLRVHLTCPEFTYAPHSAHEVILKRRIAGALRFNATLRADAERIVAALERENAARPGGGDGGYSGFHFRCEQDAASTWHVSCADARYNSAPLARAHIPPAPLLYVATGAPDDARHVDAAYAVVTKERYGNFVARYGGALDVAAAVDALVLVRARRVVGFDLSSFSFFVKWLRLVAATPALASLAAAPPEYGRGGETTLLRMGDDGTLGTFMLAFPI